jgi:hypothetical protein
MNTTIEQAETLRQQAITLLLHDKTAIEEKLAQLGFDGTPTEKKARTCSKCGQSGHNAKGCTATPSIVP